MCLSTDTVNGGVGHILERHFKLITFLQGIFLTPSDKELSVPISKVTIVVFCHISGSFGLLRATAKNFVDALAIRLDSRIGLLLIGTPLMYPALGEDFLPNSLSIYSTSH